MSEPNPSASAESLSVERPRPVERMESLLEAVKSAFRESLSWLRPKLRDPHFLVLTAFVLLVSGLYAAVGLVEHIGYRTALYDLGIYDQALRSYSHFGLPRVPVLGVRTPEHLGLLHWSDHFTPILVLLTPLYWIYSGPETLLVAHGFLFALAIPPLFVFVRRALGLVPAYAIVVTYALSWPIQQAAWFPFHQVAFAVPILTWMLERYQAEKYRHAAHLALSLLLVREDLGLMVAAFGFLLLLRGQKRLGIGLGVGGLVAVWTLTNVLIPFFGGSPRRNWTHWHFGGSPGALVLSIVRDPIAAMEYMLTPADKVRTLLWLFAPFFFLAFRSPLTLLALPLLLVRFLSTQKQYWSLEYHYNAFVFPILLCAAVDGASRLPILTLPRNGWKVPLASVWAFAVLGVTLITLPRWPNARMLKKSYWYPRTEEVREMQAALDRVPDGAFIAAPNRMGVHLTRRGKVVLWSPPGDRKEVEAIWKLQGLSWKYLGDSRLADAPWVLADVERHQFPFQSVQQQIDAVRKLKARGYVVEHDANGYVLLHLPEPHPG